MSVHRFLSSGSSAQTVGRGYPRRSKPSGLCRTAFFLTFRPVRLCRNQLRTKMNEQSEPQTAIEPPPPSPIFNLPGPVLAALALLGLIYAVQSLLLSGSGL